LVSAKTGEGLPALLSFLANSAAGGDSDVGLRVVSARQQRLVSKAAESLAATAHGLRTGVPPELAVEDLRQAVQAAGELTGDIVNDEVLGEIFSRFCIGK
jgi:tRNA modification GTPase